MCAVSVSTKNFIQFIVVMIINIIGDENYADETTQYL